MVFGFLIFYVFSDFPFSLILVMISMYLVGFAKLGKIHNIIITRLEGISAYLRYPGPSQHSEGTPHSCD